MQISLYPDTRKKRGPINSKSDKELDVDRDLCSQDRMMLNTQHHYSLFTTYSITPSLKDTTQDQGFFLFFKLIIKWKRPGISVDSYVHTAYFYPKQLTEEHKFQLMGIPFQLLE